MLHCHRNIAQIPSRKLRLRLGSDWNIEQPVKVDPIQTIEACAIQVDEAYSAIQRSRRGGLSYLVVEGSAVPRLVLYKPPMYQQGRCLHASIGIDQLGIVVG